MSDFLTGRCPNCDNRLEYGRDDQTVYCYACDSSISVSQLSGGAATSNIGGFSGSIGAALLGFDNPESGVVFLENFFETYDWQEYKESDEIPLREIAEVIQNNKIKNGAAAQSWYLDFKGLSVPVSKKFEGLKEKALEMAQKYNTYDNSEVMEAFDIYRKVMNALYVNRDAIIRQLEAAIKYAEKFKLESDKLLELKKEFKEIKAAFDGVKEEVKDVSEVPEYVAAQKKVSAQKEKELADKGIDARSVYENAIAIFEGSSPDKSQALKAFASIRGYADSVQYINKINKYFSYFSEMFYFGNKYYIYEEEDFVVPALNVGKLGKKKKKSKDAGESEEAIKALSLYEIENGVRADKPVLKGIEQIIDYYNSKLYFFKKNSGIYAFDFNTKTETCIDEGKSDDYRKDGHFEVANVLKNTVVAVKKKLKPEKGGCGCLSIFKKKQQHFNNYSLILIDLMTGKTRTVVNEMVDVAIKYDEKIFYIMAEAVKKDKHKKPIPGEEEQLDYKTVLMVCDLLTGENKRILGEDCDIHSVVGSKVVYSLWKPNDYNKDLHVYDIDTTEDILIENNILDFFDIINEKIYFTVGNDDYCPLMRTNIDGTERKEIMPNVEKVIDVRAGWLYVKKAKYKNDRNAALVKVSADGEKRIIVCTQFKKAISTSSTHIYYVDTSNCMRVVRTDGKENRVIAENVGKFFVVEDKYLYYTRSEAVNNDENSLSLYRMDKDGKNVKKLVFNVDSIANYDSDYLYYMKDENVRFKVTIPTGKKKQEERYEYHQVKRYFKYNKNNDKSELVLTLGLTKKNTFKAGCLKKKTDANIIYEEAPAKFEFKYKGLAEVGEVEQENNNKPAETPIEVIQQKFKKGCGCVTKGKKKGGCLSGLLKKKK